VEWNGKKIISCTGIKWNGKNEKCFNKFTIKLSQFFFHLFIHFFSPVGLKLFYFFAFTSHLKCQSKYEVIDCLRNLFNGMQGAEEKNRRDFRFFFSLSILAFVLKGKLSVIILLCCHLRAKLECGTAN
jgi:hypothetical protein